MRFILCCAILLSIMTQTIAGCGGGGGGGSSTTPVTVYDNTVPTVSAFTLPSTSTSKTVAISSLSASDNVGVTGYLITESATAPSASATGWSATPLATYSFSGAGTQTAYAWAKDAAGNVSTSRSATVTITLSDTIAPTVSAFILPSTSTSKTVAISSLSASDNVGVTGYLVTESATAPSASATGWSATPPATYSFSGVGTQTAYAWAKDAAGNVSTSRSATVTITLSDTIAPTVNAFTLPATSPSLTVAISSLSASDNVFVTGYLVTESATAPSASAAGWSETAPTSFTFSAVGSNTAYAWAKDAAGNVSTSRTASVTVTTKTATLKLSTQSTNSGDLIGGFYLTVTLPVGFVLQTDASGVLSSSAVNLSGQFAGAVPQDISYYSVSRELTVNYASANDYQLGEFITIVVTVPSSYVPISSDITWSFAAWSPYPDVQQLSTVTLTATFN